MQRFAWVAVTIACEARPTALRSTKQRRTSTVWPCAAGRSQRGVPRPRSASGKCAPMRTSAKLRETLGAARTIGLLQPRTIRAPMLAFSGLPQAHVMHACTCSAHSRHPPAPSRTHPARTVMRCCSERRRRPSSRPVRPVARGTHDARRARAWSSARWCRAGGTCGRGSGRARRSSGETLHVSSADAVRAHTL